MKQLFFLLFCYFGTSLLAQENTRLLSPDGKISVDVGLDSGKAFYQIHYQGLAFLDPSPLGLKTSQGDFSQNLQFLSAQNERITDQYKLDRAKQRQVNYVANQLTWTVLNEAGDSLSVVFRLTDRDLAFSYRIASASRKTEIKIYHETTGFDLPAGSTAFLSPQSPPMVGWERTKPSYEEEYTLNEALGTPSKYGVGFTFPCLFKIGNKGWLLISETGVDSRYVGSRLGEGNQEGFYPLTFPQEGENNGIGPSYASMALPAQTPWRTITLGSSLQPIVESTVAFDVVTPLYEAKFPYKPGRASWSWIVWQDGSINYDDQVKFIDLAAELDFEYILIDNWWDQRIGRDRMEVLVKYAAEKGVGVILWYNSNGYWSDAPQTPQDKMNTSPARKKEMAWLQKIGVKGLKVDFFGGDKQETIKLYEDILTDANEYGLAITFHGCTLPRGWERMYPNFVTSEAVLASENLIFTQHASDLHARNACILPFTRNAVAAMDFAPVFFNKVLSKDQQRGSIRKTSDAFELATSVLYQSPVQHFGITPNNLNEQADFVWDFIRKVPAAWDETIFLDGEPGSYVALARRKGNQWYIAVVNGENTTKEISLFLPMLKNTQASLIYDKPDRTMGIKNLDINQTAHITLTLLPQGGALIYR